MSLWALGGSAAWVLTSLILGVRLLALAQQTRRVPELTIGLTFLLSGGLASVLFVLALGMASSHAALSQALEILGWLCSLVGQISLCVFIWRVFRPAARWAAGLVAVLALVSAGSLVAKAMTAGFGVYPPTSTGFWVGWATRGATMAWASIEALRYYRKMRRRLAVGLADPLLVNRFALWGLSAACGLLMIGLTAVTQAANGAYYDAGVTWVRSAFGLVAAVSNWLVFFAPQSYRRAFEARAGGLPVELAR